MEERNEDVDCSNPSAAAAAAAVIAVVASFAFEPVVRAFRIYPSCYFHNCLVVVALQLVMLMMMLVMMPVRNVVGAATSFWISWPFWWMMSAV